MDLDPAVVSHAALRLIKNWENGMIPHTNPKILEVSEYGILYLLSMRSEITSSTST